MGRVLLNILTLGLYGFVKGKPTGNRRLGKGYLRIDTFGVPSEKLAEKILHKFIHPAEVEIALHRIRLGGRFYVKDEETFEGIATAFEKAKFPIRVKQYRHCFDTDGYWNHLPVLWDEASSGYKDLKDFDRCHSCGYGRDVFPADPPWCGNCGSRQVTCVTLMNDEEFDKHVKTIAKAEAKAAKSGKPGTEAAYAIASLDNNF